MFKTVVCIYPPPFSTRAIPTILPDSTTTMCTYTDYAQQKCSAEPSQPSTSQALCPGSAQWKLQWIRCMDSLQPWNFLPSIVLVTVWHILVLQLSLFILRIPMPPLFILIIQFLPSLFHQTLIKYINASERAFFHWLHLGWLFLDII